MGIGTTAAATSGQRGNALEWLPAAWKWAFFLIPAAVLGVSQYRTPAMPLLNQARNLVELLPDRWQTNAVAGSIEKADGDDSAALGHLQKAVELNPEYAYGESMLADIYSRSGQVEPSLQHYLKAVSLNPANYDVQARLGKMLVNAGRYAEAIPHLQIAADKGRADAESE